MTVNLGTVTTEAQLDAAIRSAATQTVADNYIITFGSGITEGNVTVVQNGTALLADLAAINLRSGVTLTIAGNGKNLIGTNTFRGLLAHGGNVAINNLTIKNAVATGGKGGSSPNQAGGGGLAAGGDIFVYSGSATAGGGSITPIAGAAGSAFGTGIFIYGSNKTVTLSPAATKSLTIGDVITDEKGEGGGNSGNVLVGDAGKVTLSATNKYSGTTTINAISFLGSIGTPRLIVEPGAVFIGTVIGGEGGPSVMEPGSAAGIGTIAGFVTGITNFTSLVFDTGTKWKVGGGAAGLGAPGIAGFTTGDTINLTGFAAVSEMFANDELVLTDGTASTVTAHVQGSFASGNFVVASDSGGGTDSPRNPS